MGEGEGEDGEEEEGREGREWKVGEFGIRIGEEDGIE